MSKELLIDVQNVSKKFIRVHADNQTSLGFLLSLFRRNRCEEFYAVNDVSLKVYKGDVLGIIGRNGSGKSTLLKIISGILVPTSGTVVANSEITYLTGLGKGLNQQSTMRQNIYLAGSLAGLTTKQINSKFDEIVQFSGLQGLEDVKVKDFSTGMTSRLSFSIGFLSLEALNPQLLLLDEVGLDSGGGDIDYQTRTKTKTQEFRKGKTVIAVSHGLSQIQKHCNRVIWIDKGCIVMEGSAKKVIAAYEKSFRKQRKSRRATSA